MKWVDKEKKGIIYRKFTLETGERIDEDLAERFSELRLANFLELKRWDKRRLEIGGSGYEIVLLKEYLSSPISKKEVIDIFQQIVDYSILLHMNGMHLEYWLTDSSSIWIDMNSLKLIFQYVPIIKTNTPIPLVNLMITLGNEISPIDEVCKNFLKGFIEFLRELPYFRVREINEFLDQARSEPSSKSIFEPISETRFEPRSDSEVSAKSCSVEIKQAVYNPAIEEVIDDGKGEEESDSHEVEKPSRAMDDRETEKGGGQGLRKARKRGQSASKFITIAGFLGILVIGILLGIVMGKNGGSQYEDLIKSTDIEDWYSAIEKNPENPRAYEKILNELNSREATEDELQQMLSVVEQNEEYLGRDQKSFPNICYKVGRTYF